MAGASLLAEWQNRDMIRNFLKILYRKLRFPGSWLAVAVSFTFFLVFLTILLTNCDVMGGSINDFINFNTGDARIKDWSFSAGTRHAKINDIWMHYPVAGGYIEIDIQIENPLDYDLALTPAVIEYRGMDGIIRDSAPANIPVRLTVNANTAMLKIGDDSHHVNRGDSFIIRINIAKADGTRQFGYYDLPQIVNDTQLYPPTGLAIDTTSNPTQPFAIWETQNENDHVGLTKITLYFESYNTDFHKGDWIYLYDLADGKWKLSNDPSAELDYQELGVRPSTNKWIFTLPFPLEGTDDFTYFSDNYNFSVTLEDKNGVVAKSTLHGANSLLWLEDVRVEQRVRGQDGLYTYRDDLVFNYKDGVAIYYLAVPFDVDGIRVTAEKKYPENQVIAFGPNTAEEPGPVVRGLAKYGVNDISMKVDWYETGSTTSEDFFIYTFKVYRSPPARDSTLKNLIVKSDKEYILSPEFAIPPDNVNEQMNVEKYYSVFVPYSIDEVSFEWDFLSTSTVYSKKANEEIWDENTSYTVVKTYSDYHYLGHNDGMLLTHPDRPGGFEEGDWFFNINDNYRYNFESGVWVNTYFNYSNYNYYFPDYGEVDSLEIWRSAQSYPVDSGENYFEIMVKPQDGDSRVYNVKVIRATSDDNPAARLADITANIGEFSQRFQPGVFSYTIDVPNGNGNITIQAQAESGARIIEINSDTNFATPPSVTPGQPVWNYDEATQTAKTDIYGITSGSTRLITVRVAGGPQGSLPNNYLIRINGSRPAMSGIPELTGANNSLTVSWASLTGNYYDIRHGSTSNVNNSTLWRTNIPASGTATTAIITGLSNNASRYVWVRERDTLGTVTEWKQAQTTQLSGTTISYGIPGLAGITNINQLAPMAILSPGFNNTIHQYTLTVPSDTPASLNTFTPSALTGNIIRKNGVIVTGPFNDIYPPAWPGDPDIDYSIDALSPDRKTLSDTYWVKVRKMLSPPENFTITPESNRILANWEPVDNVNLLEPGTYEISYKDTVTNITQTLEIPAASSPSVTITGLTNDHAYEVSVRAKRSDGLLGEESVALATPRNAGFYVNISLPGDINAEYSFENLALQNIELSWIDNEEITLTVPNNLNPVWFIDDKAAYAAVIDTENVLTVKARDYSVAEHFISLRITHEGHEYSATIKFTVVQ